jgi:hypothetical protein
VAGGWHPSQAGGTTHTSIAPSGIRILQSVSSHLDPVRSSVCFSLFSIVFVVIQYDYFAQLLKAPKTDAQLLMDARFPYPRFIECVEKGSQSRFLMAKLNPSITQSTMEYNQGSEPPVFTEDVSMKVFMQHLRRLAVQD